MDSNFSPSPVLHMSFMDPTGAISTIPAPFNVSEERIISSLSKQEVSNPLGDNPNARVVRVLILRERGYAFVEFDSTSSAQHCFNFFDRDSPIYSPVRINATDPELVNLRLKFTGRDSIQSNQNQMPMRTQNQMQRGSGDGSDFNNRSTGGGTPSAVLLCSVANVVFPVTIDVLCQIFTKYGGIKRVVIFNKKDGGVNALVELVSVEWALKARKALSGKNIYAGCNQLTVAFSNMQTLTIRENSDRAFDFVAAGGLGFAPSPGANGGNTDGAPATVQAAAQAAAAQAAAAQAAAAQAAAANPFDQFGGHTAQQNLARASAAALQPPVTTSPLQGQFDGAGGYDLNFQNLQKFQQSFASPSGQNAVQRGSLNMGNQRFGSTDFSAPQVAGNAASGAAPQSVVLIAHDLNPNLTDPLIVANLFSVYGNVVRVKIMFNKRSTVLVQLVGAFPSVISAANATGIPLNTSQLNVFCSTCANMCINNLDGKNFFGSKISVSVSKGGEINMKGTGDVNSMQYTRDLSESALSYCRHKSDKPYRPFSPARFVHLSNLPDDISVDSLTEQVRLILTKKISTVLDQTCSDAVALQASPEFRDLSNLVPNLVSMKFIADNHRSAILDFGDVSEGISAVSILHDSIVTFSSPVTSELITRHIRAGFASSSQVSMNDV